MFLWIISVSAPCSIAAQNILTVRNEFDMTRIYAGSVPTKMVEFKAIGHWPIDLFPSPSVRRYASLLTFPNSEPTITFDRQVAYPPKAAVLADFVECPEALRSRTILPKRTGDRRTFGITMKFPPLVVHRAPSAGEIAVELAADATIALHESVSFRAMRPAPASAVASILRHQK